MSKMNVILVWRSGGDFSFPDVNMICHQIRKRSKVDIYCLSDAFVKETELASCTMIPMSFAWKGWWSKMNLFSPELERLRPFLFMDLDTAVLEDVEHLNIESDDFIMLKDFYRPSLPASGLMRIPANNEKISLIWRVWKQFPETYMNKFRGDQEFISSVIKPDVYWQDIVSGIYSFKPSSRNWLNKLPEDVKIVCFHGKPRIWDATRHVEWVYNYVYGK